MCNVTALRFALRCSERIAPRDWRYFPRTVSVVVHTHSVLYSMVMAAHMSDVDNVGGWWVATVFFVGMRFTTENRRTRPVVARLRSVDPRTTVCCPPTVVGTRCLAACFAKSRRLMAPVRPLGARCRTRAILFFSVGF